MVVSLKTFMLLESLKEQAGVLLQEMFQVFMAKRMLKIYIRELMVCCDLPGQQIWMLLLVALGKYNVLF
jgi:hypothetical protein